MEEKLPEKSVLNLPLYLKFAQVITGLFLLTYSLYITQEIVVPIVFSLIISILLNPFINFLTRKGMNRVLAIVFSILLAFLLLSALSYFIISQLSLFSDAFPALKSRFNELTNDFFVWISKTFHVTRYDTKQWFSKIKNDGLTNGSAILGSTLGTLTGIIINMILLPVYIFMILYYKPLLLEFIAKLFKYSRHKVVAEVLVETRLLIQNYLVGLLIEMAIVGTLNVVGLLILGVQYALLIGVIGAILNVIPYIGGLVAIALPMLMALATQSPSVALWVFIVYLIVQFIDNHYIVPQIVASKVKINGLISIVVVLAGGALWGVSGMFLSIPLTAIIKVIFDRVESLEPYGFLLGDNQPEIGKQIFNFKLAIRKKKQ